MFDRSKLLSVAPLLPYRDLARAIEYFQDVLGFQPRFINMGGGTLPVFAILARDGLEVHLVSVRNRVMNRRDRLVPGSASCSFRVRRIEDVLDRCERFGADVIHEDFTSGKYGLRTFTIADLEGNEITFAEEARRPPGRGARS